MSRAPEVTVSIVSGGDAELLRGCLRSLPEAAAGRPLQVVVLDNASGAGIAAAVGAARPEVEVVEADRRRGFGANHNLVAARARAPYLFVLNDDTVLEPGCIDRLASLLDRNAALAAAGPRIAYPDGREQPSAFHLPTPARVVLTALTLQRLGWVQSGGGRVRSVGWISGAAMLLRRAAFDEVGGFDERYFMYLEDVDLCRRLRGRGWEVAYLPHARLVHHESASSAAAPLRRVHQHARSRAAYARRHHGLAGALVIQGATALMYGARMAIAAALRRVPGGERLKPVDPALAGRFGAHALAALRPGRGEAIEDAAADWNGRTAGGRAA